MIPQSKTSETIETLRFQSRLISALPAVICGWLFCVIAVTGPAAASGQTGKRVSLHLPQSARYVPDGVGVFVELDHISKIEKQLSNSSLWRILEQVSGGQSGEDWRRLLTENLGVDPGGALRALLRTRFAVVAEDWDRLGDGAILFSPPRSMTPREILKLFAGQAPYRSEKQDGSILMVETRGGVWVAVGGAVVVLSRKSGTGSTFDAIMAVLSGRTRKTLYDLPDFRSQVGHLPAPRHGCAFWTDRRRGATTAPVDAISELWPTMNAGAIGLYIRRSQIELVMRDPSSSKEEFIYKPRVDVGRLLTLPQSTLAAWSVAVDVGEVFAQLRANREHSAASRLWDYFDRHVDAERFERDVLGNLGPRCMVVVGCDFASQERIPQIGLMLESVDPQTVNRALVDFALRITGGEAGAPDSKVRLVESEYLGESIYELHLQTSIQPQSNNALAVLIADEMTPSWTILRGWVVAATSPKHLHSIIETHNGLTPTLGEVLDIRRTGLRLHRAVGVALIQPAFTLSTLRHWGTILKQRSQSENAPGARLGIRIQAEWVAGQALVADVDSNGPAAGVLEAGDVIIGCGGTLLSMEKPNDHLRELVSQHTGGQAIRLRLLRRGAVVEASVAGDEPSDDLRGSTGLQALLKLIKPLENIANELSLAVYSVERPPRGARQAQLVLRFDDRHPVPNRVNN